MILIFKFFSGVIFFFDFGSEKSAILVHEDCFPSLIHTVKRGYSSNPVF